MFYALSREGHGISRSFIVKKFWILMSLIIAFGTISKLVNLSHPKDFYFDEVYHGYTATQHLRGNRDAYDPWAQPPKGRANEWTHPPLGKLVMALTMAFVGENSFGWRLSSVFMGGLLVLITSLLALELLGSKKVARSLSSMHVFLFSDVCSLA